MATAYPPRKSNAGALALVGVLAAGGGGLAWYLSNHHAAATSTCPTCTQCTTCPTCPTCQSCPVCPTCQQCPSCVPGHCNAVDPATAITDTYCVFLGRLPTPSELADRIALLSTHPLGNQLHDIITSPEALAYMAANPNLFN